MKLLELTEKLTDRLRLENKSHGTIESYAASCKKFFGYLSTHPETREMDFSTRLESFLTWRVVHNGISPSTQNSDYWALHYLGTKILGIDVGKIKPLRARRRERIPHIIGREDVFLFLENLPGVHQLIGKIMYGTGLRVKVDCLRLRIKDISFSTGKIFVHESKGDKDRLVPIPQILIVPLKDQIEQALGVWKQDRYHRVDGVQLPHALAKKNPNLATSKDWFWVFPNPNLGRDENGVMRRHHFYDWDVADQFLVTRRKLGLPEFVTPHALRHFFATHFIEDLLRQGIPESMAEAELIKWMGHVDPKTLKYYVHLASPKSALVRSPIDTMESRNLYNTQNQALYKSPL